MKKLHFWTWAFIIVGIITFIASTIWFNKYPNLSEYFVYLGGAVFLWMLAGLIEVLKKVMDKQVDLENNQRELQRWVTEQERYNEESH